VSDSIQRHSSEPGSPHSVDWELMESLPLIDFGSQLPISRLLFRKSHTEEMCVCEDSFRLVREKTRARLLQSSRFHHLCRFISWESEELDEMSSTVKCGDSGLNVLWYCI